MQLGIYKMKTDYTSLETWLGLQEELCLRLGHKKNRDDILALFHYITEDLSRPKPKSADEEFNLPHYFCKFDVDFRKNTPRHPSQRNFVDQMRKCIFQYFPICNAVFLIF